VPFEATVVVAGPAAEVRSLIRYADARVNEIDDATCRVLIRSESRPWLTTVIALIAGEFGVAVEDPADLVPEVKRLGARLRAVAPTSAR